MTSSRSWPSGPTRSAPARSSWPRRSRPRRSRSWWLAGGSFEALAMERSRDAATRFNGGDLGYFTADIMPEAYDAALKGAKAGQIVGPVRGRRRLRAAARSRTYAPNRPIPLEAARPQIVRFLTYDRIRDLLEKPARQGQGRDPDQARGRRAEGRAARRCAQGPRPGRGAASPREPRNDPQARQARRRQGRAQVDDARGSGRPDPGTGAGPADQRPEARGAEARRQGLARLRGPLARARGAREAGQGREGGQVRHAGLAAGRALPAHAADRRAWSWRPDGPASTSTSATTCW